MDVENLIIPETTSSADLEVASFIEEKMARSVRLSPQPRNYSEKLERTNLWSNTKAWVTFGLVSSLVVFSLVKKGEYIM